MLSKIFSTEAVLLDKQADHSSEGQWFDAGLRLDVEVSFGKIPNSKLQSVQTYCGSLWIGNPILLLISSYYNDPGKHTNQFVLTNIPWYKSYVVHESNSTINSPQTWFYCGERAFSSCKTNRNVTHIFSILNSILLSEKRLSARPQVAQ